MYGFHTLRSCCSLPLVPKAWIFTANLNFHSKPQQGGPGKHRALPALELRLLIKSKGADGSSVWPSRTRLLQWESRMSLCRDCKTHHAGNTRECSAGVQPWKTELRELQLSVSCWHFNPPNTREGIRALVGSTSDAAELCPKGRG